MPEATRTSPRPSGVTLVELMIALGITAIVALLATQTYVAFVRDDAMRRKVTNVQGGTRLALDVVGRELRLASLGAGTGRVWTISGGNRVARPAVQIFSDLAGAGTLDLTSATPRIAAPKPQTDALLVVEAVGRERGATSGELTGATAGMPRTFNVTTTSWTDAGDGYSYALHAGEPVLVGDYQEASWAVLETVDLDHVTVAQDLVLPGAQVPRLAAGAVVRRARARLYYVDALDQLIRLELAVPRPPTAAGEITGREVLATGIENLQIQCDMTSPTGALALRTGALASGHAISTESAGAFSFGAGGGPMLQADDSTGGDSVSNLRAVVVEVVARSATPLVGSTAGDGRVQLDGVTLGDETAAYVRRSYQLGLGVRNTSLGDL
jgi:prepilin-type N-terminal cleavage/methylation domain-containing protein